MTDTRLSVLETIADILVERATTLPSRVLRVAVTGITASGKSTLACTIESCAACRCLSEE
jgi:uridine kinase